MLIYKLKKKIPWLTFRVLRSEICWYRQCLTWLLQQPYLTKKKRVDKFLFN